jgi:hypothetical protein
MKLLWWRSNLLNFLKVNSYQSQEFEILEKENFLKKEEIIAL